MLLPDKFVSPAGSLVGQAVQLWRTMPHAMTVGEAWFFFRDQADQDTNYMRFVLTLDVLFALALVDLDENILIRKGHRANRTLG